ncbi:MAG TPA: flagellar basal body P-ring formation chaperone FlgA [Hyphomicrobiaceae bacterium]|jgi:flagella basal body P-ring formation protein FlgA|nr:flagellar basal body P-ring formation chaperone FlgA [Hyphomicrobiaceae bacterium]
MRRILQAAAASLVASFAVVLAISGNAHASGLALPVPTVTILQGDVLADELVGEERFIVNARQVQGFFTSRDAVVGKVARRVLPAGHAIPINALREPWVFKEGDRVPIVFAFGGLNIEATGIALEPGIAGKLISVRNADTGIIVRGVVAESGRVEVGKD